MFDIGFSELLVIAAVALVVLGPEELPGVMLKIGRMAGALRRQMGKWQAEIEEAALDAEIREHNKKITEGNLSPAEMQPLPKPVSKTTEKDHDDDQPA